MLSSLFLLLSVSTTIALVLGKCSNDTFGADCRYSCYCKVNTSCNEDNGHCAEGCALGWEDEACQTRDVAFVMPAVAKGDRGNASWAVDGNSSTCLSLLSNSTGWWKVDLLRDYKLFRLRISTDRSFTLWGWRVFVSPYDNVFFTKPCTTLRRRGHVAEVTCDTPMVGQYVGILATPGPFHLCDFSLLVCEPYSFGTEDCSRRCRCRDPDEVCDPVYGSCRSGCPTGWTGRDCQSACNRTYGLECVHSCGHCAGGAQCDRVTGHCHGGCDPGWAGVKCQALCPSGWWGAGCRQQCGHCQGDLGCQPARGLCKAGCQAGWTGDTCLTECSWGWFGENCRQACGRCHGNSTCDARTGICSQGCQTGWEGVFCDHGCLYGYFGHDCGTPCGKCASPPCDVSTGHCDEAGCEEGWGGPGCKSPCPKGKFGNGCQQTCGHCAGGQTCFTTNGSCPQGCLPGWNASQCLLPCPEGFHGQDCLSPCGKCAQGAPCDHVTGLCPNDCEPGFTGADCLERLGLQEVGRQVLADLMGISVGTVGFALVIVIVCLILKWRREYSLQEIQAIKHREEEGMLM